METSLDVAQFCSPIPCWHAPITDHALESLRPRGIQEIGDRRAPGSLQARSPRWSCASWPTSTGCGDRSGGLDGITDGRGRSGQGLQAGIRCCVAMRTRAARTPPHGVPVLIPIEIKGQKRKVGGSCWAATAGLRRRAVMAARTRQRAPRSYQLSCRAVGRLPPVPTGCRSTTRAGPSQRRPGRINGSPNELVVRWIKRGPTGVIRTNKKDAQDTVDTLIKNLSSAKEGAE